MQASSVLSPEQVVEIDVGFPEPASVGNAVVFIRATWSGYSESSLRNLAEGMKSGLDSTWKLILVNTDTLDFEAFSKAYGPFPSSGGWGEAFWIKGGSLVYSDRGYYNAALIKVLWERIHEFSSSEQSIILPDFSDQNSFHHTAIENCGKFPAQCLEIDDQNCSSIEHLHMAVVTLYSPGRMSALVTLGALAKELMEASLSGMRLIVLNADAVPYSDMERTFGEKPIPARTYWIRHGQVVFRDDGYYLLEHRETLAQRIDAFRRIAD